MKTPQQIWICGLGKEPSDWIAERMISGQIAPDGSFDIEASDGTVHVEKGHAVFQVDGEVYACPSRQMSEKLAAIAPEHPAVQQVLAERPAPTPKAAPAARKAISAPKALKFRPVVGAPCTPANIPIGQLEVDDTYQRSIEGGASQKAIEKIAANWDWRLCLPLLGSRRRDGKIYIIDGQHRKEGAQLRGDIPWLPVIIFDFDDPKDEAELFVAANRSRRAMGKLDDFHAAIVAGDKDCIAIDTVVREAGLTIARNGSWTMLKEGEVIFVGIIRRAMKTHGREIIALALSMLARAFPDQVLIGGGAIFEGLCAIIADGEKSRDVVEVDLMALVLAEVGLPGWKQAIEAADADSGYDRREAMTKALRRAYDEARAQ